MNKLSEAVMRHINYYDIDVSDSEIKIYGKGTSILHCLEGPAVIKADGSKQYFLLGKEFTEEEFNEKIYGRKELNCILIKKSDTKEVSIDGEDYIAIDDL